MLIFTVPSAGQTVPQLACLEVLGIQVPAASIVGIVMPMREGARYEAEQALPQPEHPT
jgi:hypothetical protein